MKVSIRKFQFQFSVILILMLFLTACNPSLDALSMDESAVDSPQESEPSIQTADTAAPVLESTATSLPPTQTPIPPTPTVTVVPTPELISITGDNLRSLIRKQSAIIEFPRDIAWNEDGTIIVLTESKLLSLNQTTLEIIAETPLTSEAQLLDLSPNGELIAQTADMFSIEIVEISTGEILQLLEPGEQFMAAHFSPDSNRLLIPSLDNIKGIEYDVHTGTRLNEYTGFTFAGPVYDVSYSQYTNDLIWISRGSVRVMDRETGALSPYFGHEDFVSSLALTPDGQILITAAAATIDGNYSPALYFWSRSTGEILALVPVESFANELTITPDGLVLIAAVDSSLLFFQPITQELLLKASGHADKINLISLAPQSKALITASFDNSVVMWQIPK